MGYEEVETVLPADFVPKPDRPEEPEQTQEAMAIVEQSEPESEAEDAGCNGLRKKKKKKKASDRTGRSSRKSMLSRWRSSRSKSRGRSKKEGSSTSKDDTKKRSGSKSRSKLGFRTIRKVDSNATELVSNTTKAKEEREQEPAKEEKEVADINSKLHPVREGSPDNTATTGGTEEEKAVMHPTGITAPSPAPTTISTSEISIEVGDENEQVNISISIEDDPKKEDVVPALKSATSRDASVRSTKSNRSTSSKASVKSGRSVKSKKSGESLKSAKSGESIKSAKSGEKAEVPVIAATKSSDASVRSTKSTSSKRSIKSSKSKSKEEDSRGPLVVANSKDSSTASDRENLDDNAEEPGLEAAADNQQSTKWVKKVSLSIAGYKTSFQIRDPMTNLADAVNDALDVVGGDEANLVQQAKNMDSSNDASDDMDEDEERDYDENPTQLFMYLQQRAWGLALTQLKEHPDEARVWVYRKSKPEKAPNVPDADDHSKAMVVQHTALVVHDGNEMPKYRWKLLPLHAAIVLGAPTEIIQDIVRAYPNAAKRTDERGSLPVHLAASRLDVDPEGEKVVLQLFGAYPDSIEMQDRKGRTPPELAKLARSRKDIEEQRKINSSASQQSQVGMECTASQNGCDADDKDGDNDSNGSGDAEEDVDDDSSVKSNLSARFRQMLRKSKSTDTVDRRKKKKKKEKKSSNWLTPAKSMDGGVEEEEEEEEEEEPVDDAVIAESLGPGFAFLKTSKSQEVRERAEAEEENDEDDDEPTEAELLKSVKQAVIGREYQMPDTAPMETKSHMAIPLPMSFCDDGSVRSSRSNKSSRSSRSNRSSRSHKSKTRSSSPEGEKTLTISQTSSNDSGTKAKEVPPVSTPMVSAPAPTEKAVTIAEDPPVVHEIESQTVTEDKGENESAKQDQSVNEGLRVLLEKAAENAGRGGLDVTEFVKTLEDEWVTDVEALRRLDGDTLDDLLPLMLSRELQRLINHADSIDNKFLKEENENPKLVPATSTRGRSPKKSTKKKKKKRSHKRSKKRGNYRPVSPPDGALTPISEEADSPSTVDSDDHLSIITEARTVYSARSAPPKLHVPDIDNSDDGTSSSGSRSNLSVVGEVNEDGSYDQDTNEEEYADDISQSASIEDLEIRKLHANLIADARKKFPTREALEDSIAERQAEVEAAVNSGFDVDKQTLARAALADDEVRKLLPLRLILPTIADLQEMIGVLQIHKEGAMRNLNMEKARNIQSEIDELEDQINKEERYLMNKRLDAETKCAACGVMFPTEKKMAGILKTKEKSCVNCRGGDNSEDSKSADSSNKSVIADIEVVTVESRDDENN
eukprot:CAMPEP_0183744824 /NCGR_PEP_ID=MMETSP0737-20130205/65927_1 /TAXON_ID=385413 /ORGANISM="Thalassiosira miniscula, Strain CCMP1093" /LENGTH=1321 /DNA_ID=CAMNT_0025980477 /DNA_START=126 /DNA_END=4091 /DNA_ORIENTATION=+